MRAMLAVLLVTVSLVAASAQGPAAAAAKKLNVVPTNYDEPKAAKTETKTGALAHDRSVGLETQGTSLRGYLAARDARLSSWRCSGKHKAPQLRAELPRHCLVRDMNSIHHIFVLASVAAAQRAPRRRRS